MPEPLEIGQPEVYEDWEIDKVSPLRQAFHKQSGKHVSVAEGGQIRHRRSIDKATHQRRSVLYAELDGVAVYIRGKQIVLAKVHRIEGERIISHVKI